MDGRTRGTTVDRGTRSGVRRTGTCRRRCQAAQDRLGRWETAIDRAVDGPHPCGASGRASPPDRNSRAGLARKLCARILLRTPTRGTRPAHRTLARRLWAHVTNRRRIAENSALSRVQINASSGLAGTRVKILSTAVAPIASYQELIHSVGIKPKAPHALIVPYKRNDTILSGA